MERITFSITYEMHDRLKKIAAKDGKSMASVIREALAAEAYEYRLRPRSLGIGSSGTKDTARQAGETRPEPRSWR
ncbi:MAG: ribbon-helix-helix protein, CopG family [Chloroflexi bacterium]|nr:ribbon-helix-helix protein, CopG family [Chloroflexota bacterium]